VSLLALYFNAFPKSPSQSPLAFSAFQFTTLDLTELTHKLLGACVREDTIHLLCKSEHRMGGEHTELIVQ
jgi:hypothetical protein